MTAHDLRAVALHAINPDGLMRTVEDDLPLPEVRALRKQVRDVEAGPYRLVLVIPRPGRKPRIVGRAATERATTELLEVVGDPLD